MAYKLFRQDDTTVDGNVVLSLIQDAKGCEPGANEELRKEKIWMIAEFEKAYGKVKAQKYAEARQLLNPPLIKLMAWTEPGVRK
jgi:hypothetical protein